MWHKNEVVNILSQLRHGKRYKLGYIYYRYIEPNNFMTDPKQLGEKLETYGFIKIIDDLYFIHLRPITLEAAYELLATYFKDERKED